MSSRMTEIALIFKRKAEKFLSNFQICMSPKNGTQNGPMTDWKHREFTGYEKSQAIGVVAAGALIANPGIVILINRYGPRYLFTVII